MSWVLDSKYGKDTAAEKMIVHLLRKESSSGACLKRIWTALSEVVKNSSKVPAKYVSAEYGSTKNDAIFFSRLSWARTEIGGLTWAIKGWQPRSRDGKKSGQPGEGGGDWAKLRLVETEREQGKCAGFTRCLRWNRGTDRTRISGSAFITRPPWLRPTCSSCASLGAHSRIDGCDSGFVVALDVHAIKRIHNQAEYVLRGYALITH